MRLVLPQPLPSCSPLDVALNLQGFARGRLAALLHVAVFLSLALPPPRQPLPQAVVLSLETVVLDFESLELLHELSAALFLALQVFPELPRIAIAISPQLHHCLLPQLLIPHFQLVELGILRVHSRTSGVLQPGYRFLQLLHSFFQLSRRRSAVAQFHLQLLVSLPLHLQHFLQTAGPA